MTLTFLVWGSQVSATVPDGWAARVATIGEVEVDDCVELDPQAAPDAATTAATAMSRPNLDVPAMDFTILLPSADCGLPADVGYQGIGGMDRPDLTLRSTGAAC